MAFFLGILATLPAIAIQGWSGSLLGAKPSSAMLIFFSSFAIVAASEEMAKCAVLLIGAFPRKFFNEPMDGIVYAVLVAMGFATVENLLYGAIYGLETILIRSITAVPAHGIFGVMIGYAFGMMKFKHLTRKQALSIMGYAILLHGVYDFFIIQNASDYLLIGALVTLGVGIWISLRYIRQAQNLSPFKGAST